MIYQHLNVYGVGIHGYQEHPRNPKYALIPNAKALIGTDQERGKEMNPITVMIILLGICLAVSLACLALAVYLLLYIRRKGVKEK